MNVPEENIESFLNVYGAMKGINKIFVATHTLTNWMLYGLTPAKVSLANSSSESQKNLSPAIRRLVIISIIENFTFYGIF